MEADKYSGTEEDQVKKETARCGNKASDTKANGTTHMITARSLTKLAEQKRSPSTRSAFLSAAAAKSIAHRLLKVQRAQRGSLFA